MLKHYWTVTRKPDRELPEELSLLGAKVVGKTADTEHSQTWGHAEGAIVDEERAEITFFVARVNVGGGPSRRVLIPMEAVTVVYPKDSLSLQDAVLELDWTPDQLRAQPSFNADDRLPQDRKTGGPPVTSRWMPARPNVVPPGMQTNWSAGKWFGLGWGFAAGVASAVIGVLIGGLLVGVTLALFIGLGAGIAGFLVGASREPAADASEFDTTRPLVVSPEIQSLERALRHRSIQGWDVLTHTRIAPTAVSPRRGDPLRPATATS